MTIKKFNPRIPNGEEIKKRMKELNINQSDLAIKTGISQPMISAFINEKTEICSKHLRKIIKVLWG